MKWRLKSPTYSVDQREAEWRLNHYCACGTYILACGNFQPPDKGVNKKQDAEFQDGQIQPWNGLKKNQTNLESLIADKIHYFWLLIYIYCIIFINSTSYSVQKSQFNYKND